MRMQPNKPAETFPSGIRRAWLDNNQIALILTHSELTDEVQSAWHELLSETLREWPEGQPILLMQDLSQPGPIIPRTGRGGRFNGHLRDDQVVYNAIIIGGGRVKSVVSRLMRLAKIRDSAHKERVFTSRDAAYAWLRKAMKPIQ
jgi:hypothetical protein